jgi:hypothetical protein
LPQGHLAYFINDTVDGLDLSAFLQEGVLFFDGFEAPARAVLSR